MLNDDDDLIDTKGQSWSIWDMCFARLGWVGPNLWDPWTLSTATPLYALVRSKHCALRRSIFEQATTDTYLSLNFKGSHTSSPYLTDHDGAQFPTRLRRWYILGLLCIIWSYFPWDACSTEVQHGNWVKTCPKKTFLYHFHAEKALFKGPKSAT